MSETQYRVTAASPTYCGGHAMPAHGPKLGDVFTATVNGEPLAYYIDRSQIEEIRPFKVGDRVRVSADAEGTYFGVETEGEVVAIDTDTSSPLSVRVEAPDDHGNKLGQWCSPGDLTLVEVEPDAPAPDEDGADRPTLDRADTFPMALDLALRAAEVGIDVDDLIANARKIQDALA